MSAPHHNIDAPSDEMHEESFKKFKEECSHFPAQYTPDWFARVDSIGGSEMDDLIHRPYVLAAKKIRTLFNASRPAPICEVAPLPEMRVHVKKVVAIDSMEGIDFVCAPKEAARVTPCAQGVIDSMEGIDFLCAHRHSESPREEKTFAPPLRDPDASNIATISMSAGVVMGWGTLFEPELCNYIVGKLAIPVECRSVSYFKNPWRFSPDGIFRDACGKYALLEMKNPYVRVWSGWDAANNDQFVAPYGAIPASDIVPPRYIPQLQMGLHLIPFLSYAFYVEAIYRRANDHGVSRAVGVQKMSGVREASVLDSGIIGFYQKSGTGDLDTVFNFGAYENDFILCHVLSHQRDGDNSFIPIYFADQPSCATTAQQYCHVFKKVSELPLEYDGKPLFGYMPWNLLGIHSAVIRRNTKFLTDAMHKNADFISAFVHKHMSPDETDEQKISGLRSLSENAVINGDSQSIAVEDIIKEITARV